MTNGLLTTPITSSQVLLQKLAGVLVQSVPHEHLNQATRLLRSRLEEYVDTLIEYEVVHSRFESNHVEKVESLLDEFLADIELERGKLSHLR